MANTEKSGALKYKDDSGNVITMYPRTKVANVEGLEDWTSAMLLKSVTAALPVSASWFSVCYGNGKFVAIAYNSAIAAYSTDGINWIQTTLPANANWYSVCYGNGKFVAVAHNSTIAAYSTDGINWTQATLPVSTNWYLVCYGNGKFVTVADGTSIAACSTDGINWTQATLPVSTNWNCCCYGNGKFVVLSSSTIAAYSTDGINWTRTTLPASASWHSVCYGNGKFVAVSISSNIAAYSTDGINWIQAMLPTSATWMVVCYGNGKFVAIAYNSAIAAYSTDGINWIQTTLPANANWYSVCYGNGKFVAIINGSTITAYSIDGVNWICVADVVNNPTGTDITDNLKKVLGVDTILSDANAYADEKIDDAQKLNKPIAATSTDGIAYTAIVPEMTALTAGFSFIMIPDKISASVNATLNVNSLGAKNLRIKDVDYTGLTVAPKNANWLASGKPVHVTYDGASWTCDLYSSAEVQFENWTFTLENGNTVTKKVVITS